MTFKFKNIPQYTGFGNYKVDVSWAYLEEHIQTQIDCEDGFDLDPDFQRAHVWTEDNQRKYVEYILRGGYSGKDLFFNCPGFQRISVNKRGPYVIVDGKQRLEAVRKFMRGELSIFHNGLLGNKKILRIKDFEDKPDILRARFHWYVNDLETRAEVLQWYLDLNSSGVVHTNEELDRVKKLLEREKK